MTPEPTPVNGPAEAGEVGYGTAKWRRRALLVLEDNDDDFHFLQRAVGKLQFPPNLVRFTTVSETLAYFGEGKVRQGDVFLLDLKLTGEFGFTVLETVRKDPALKGLVVLVFSSSSERGDVDRALQLGANAYIQKPGGGMFEETVSLICKFWFETCELPPIMD